jgi:hypothetical protein
MNRLGEHVLVAALLAVQVTIAVLLVVAAGKDRRRHRGRPAQGEWRNVLARLAGKTPVVRGRHSQQRPDL